MSQCCVSLSCFFAKSMIVLRRSPQCMMNSQEEKYNQSWSRIKRSDFAQLSIQNDFQHMCLIMHKHIANLNIRSCLGSKQRRLLVVSWQHCRLYFTPSRDQHEQQPRFNRRSSRSGSFVQLNPLWRRRLWHRYWVEGFARNLHSTAFFAAVLLS